MVKIWCEDYTSANRPDAGFPNSGWFTCTPFTSGNPLEGKLPGPPAVQLRTKVGPTDYFVTGDMMVISARLQALFVRFGAKAEYFPVALFRKRSNTPEDGYFFPNLLDVVDCLDWERSMFSQTYYEKWGRADNIRKIAFIPAAGASVPLFRIAKTIPSMVGASDELARAVIEGKYTGVRLVDPEDWRNPDPGVYLR